MRWKSQYTYYLIFAICFAGFQYIEDVVRVNDDRSNPLVSYLLGVTPNFLPAIGISALFFVMIPELWKSTRHRLLTTKRHITVVVVSVSGLIAWEFVQIAAPNGTFDWHDVLWTLIGGVCFLILQRSISSQRKMNAHPLQRTVKS